MSTLIFFVVSPATDKKNLEKAFKASVSNGHTPVLCYDKYGSKDAMSLTHLRVEEEDKVSCQIAFSLKAVHRDKLTELGLDAEFIHSSGVRAHTWCFSNDPLVKNNVDFLKAGFTTLDEAGFIGDKGRILSAEKGDKTFKLPALEVGKGFAAFILEDEVSENANGFFLKTERHLFSKEVRFVDFHKNNQIEFLSGF